MNPHQWQRVISAFRSRGSRRGPAVGTRRRRRPGVELMEPRQLLSTIAEFPTTGAGPFMMVAGPDSNLWFTEATANKIAVINPSTHVVTDFATPTANSEPEGITLGPDGNLWFTEESGNRIGEFKPSTQSVSDYTIQKNLC
jgi:streptogramin lyase